MESVEASIAAIQEAAVKGGEAIAVLQRMQQDLIIAMGLVGQVEDIIAALNNPALSKSLNNYFAQVSLAHEEGAKITTQIQEIKLMIEAGQHMGETYISILLA